MNTQIDTIKAIQNTQRKISIFIGVAMGVLLLFYFFSFGMLVDKGYSFLIKFEAVTAIIFVIAFFFLNKISFYATKLLYITHSPQRQILSQLVSSDLNKAPEDIQAGLANKRIQ